MAGRRWVDDGGVAWVVAAAEEVVVGGWTVDAVVVVAARPPRWRQAACRLSRRASMRWVVVLVGGIGASVFAMVTNLNKKGTVVEYDQWPYVRVLSRLNRRREFFKSAARCLHTP